MDQERTMRFILDNLAAVTVSQQRAEERAARADRRIETNEKHIRGLTTLMKVGMKLIGKLEKGHLELQERQREIQDGHRELQRELKELAAAQKRTDQKFDRWLDSLKNGSNGHSGHKKR